MKDIQRREFLGLGGATVASVGMTNRIRNFFQGSSTFSPLVRSRSTMTGLSLPDRASVSGGSPKWHVYVEEENGLQSLELWIDAGDGRTVVSKEEDRNRAVIVAPIDDVGPSFLDNVFGRGLHTESWVESIDLVLSINTDPPRIVRSVEDFDMNLSIMERIMTQVRDLSTGGIAFNDDVEATHMTDIIDKIGGDSDDDDDDDNGGDNDE